MTERPILFSAPMVRAILAGTKTQTRRVVKVPAGHSFRSLFRMSLNDNNAPPFGLFASVIADGTNHGTLIRCPYTDGTQGDRLWVRETFGSFWGGWKYRATDDRPDLAEGNWHPSIHMPRAASRITLSVESVRVERLHDISEQDARAEGMTPDDAIPSVYSPREAFRLLWGQINGAESWDANPYVWAIGFSRVTP